MYLRFLLLVALAGALWTSSEALTYFRKCTEEIPAPLAVQLNDCEALPCVVNAGSSANVTIQFTAVNQTETAFTQIIVYINGDAMPIEVAEDVGNVCNHLTDNVKCPLSAGQTATYAMSMPLDSGLPDISLSTEIALVNDQGQCMTCFVVDLRVLSKKNLGPEEEMD